MNDDFGDVFGFFFALSGESFTNPELVRCAEQLRRELVLVPGVGKVAIGGAIPADQHRYLAGENGRPRNHAQPAGGDTEQVERGV